MWIYILFNIGQTDSKVKDFVKPDVLFLSMWFSACDDSGALQLKKIWPSIHTLSFGSHVTVCEYVHPPRPSVRPHHRETNLKMSHFLGSVGACNLILHIHGQLTAVKTWYPLTSITWSYCGVSCPPIEIACFLFCFVLFFSLSSPLTSLHFSSDRRLNSKWISLQSWQVYCLK